MTTTNTKPDRETMISTLAEQLRLDPRVVLAEQKYKERRYGKPVTVSRSVYKASNGVRAKGVSARSRVPRANRETYEVTQTTREAQTRVERSGVRASLGNRTGFGRTTHEACRALAELCLL